MGSNNKYLEYLLAHKNCTEELMKFALDPISEQLDPETDGIEDTINDMISEVKLEVDEIEESIHLAQLDENIYYSFINSEHNIELILAKHLARRFNDRIIIIGNLEFSYITYFKKNKLTELYSSGLLVTLEWFRELMYNVEESCSIEDVFNGFRNYNNYSSNMTNEDSTNYQYFSNEFSHFQINE